MNSSVIAFILDHRELLVDLLNSPARWDIIDKFMLSDRIFFSWIAETSKEVASNNANFGFISFFVDTYILIMGRLTILELLREFVISDDTRRYSLLRDQLINAGGPGDAAIICHQLARQVKDLSFFNTEFLYWYYNYYLLNAYLKPGINNNEISEKIADYIILQISEGNLSTEFLEFLSSYFVM
jgi:hypothetical protein